MKRNFFLVIVFFVFLNQGISSAETKDIKIDGNCDEWNKISVTANDAIGDIDSDDVVDFVKVWIVPQDNDLYLSYLCGQPMDWNTEAWRYNIFMDLDDNIETGYRGLDNKWALGADYLVQGATVYKFNGAESNGWSWEDLGMCSYSVDGAQAEVAVPYSLIDLKQNQKIKVLFYGDNAKKIDYVPDDYMNKTIIVIK